MAKAAVNNELDLVMNMDRAGKMAATFELCGTAIDALNRVHIVGVASDADAVELKKITKSLLGIGLRAQVAHSGIEDALRMFVNRDK